MKEQDLLARFNAGDRAALAKVITLVESTAAVDEQRAKMMLAQLEGRTHETIRVAISGPPGVGKSTFINTLGKKIVARGFKLAILPVDPSSDISSGSILADKTRMKDLLQSDDIYIRPSPSQGALGGVAIHTPDVVFVVEAFGFNFIIIETVGVGQSEMFARMQSDHFVVLMQPGSGDQLQAMKKGILERADFILVNKDDGVQQSLARATLSSLHALISQDDGPHLASMSALTDTGVDEILESIIHRHHLLKTTGVLEQERQIRLRDLCEQIFLQTCARRLKEMAAIKARSQNLADDIYAHHRAIGPAISGLVSQIINKL